MYNIVNYADYDAGVKDCIVDTVSEIASLPGSMGSAALCMEDTSLYIKDSQGIWRKMTGGFFGGSGGASAKIEPLEVTENGIYTPPEGVAGYSPVTVDVKIGFATGTVTVAEERFVNPTSLIINHGLGVIPNRFCWFVVDPINENGYSVPSNFPIAAFYSENGLSGMACGSSTSSPDMKYLTVAKGIEQLRATENTIRASLPGYTGALATGTTIRWFVWGD